MRHRFACFSGYAAADRSEERRGRLGDLGTLPIEENALVAARRTAGWTIAEAARKLGVDAATWGD